MSFTRKVWEDIKKGKTGIWIGALGGAITYFVWNFASPSTFGLFASAPPSVFEQVTNVVIIPFKGLIMMTGIGAFVGWFIDVNNWGDRYLKRFAKWLKGTGAV